MIPAAHPEQLVGSTLDRKYLIEKLLGTGSMGAVYRAHQIALDRTVAIKVMSASLASDPEFAERFHREAKAASRLAHPSSVGVSDFGEAGDGLLYLVMEYVPGKNLDVVIQEEFPLHERRIANILSQVLSAVASAHDLGIVHRDLKPENILVVPSLDDDGVLTDIVKVCDFGIAKMLGVDDAPARERGSMMPGGRKLTAVGTVLGTPAYMSPEQGQGLAPEPRSDLYAIGGMLFEMLTKRIPFDLDTPEDLVRAHMVAPVPDPRDVVPTCSPALANVCVRALQKRPDDRFATARAMRAEVTRMLRVSEHDDESAPLSTISLPRGGRGTDASLPPAEINNTTPTLMPGVEDDARATLARSPALRSFGRRTGIVFAGIGALAVVAVGLAAWKSPPPRGTGAQLAPATSTPAVTLPRSATPDDTPLPVVSVGSAARDDRPSTPKPVATESTSGATPPPRASGAVALATAVAPASSLLIAESAREIAPALVEPPPATVVAASQPSPSPSPSTEPASAPPPAVAAAYSPDRAQVVVSVTGATGTSRAVITALVDHVSFVDCYRTALRAAGAPEGGRATMHLDIDEDGVVHGATARLPGALSSASSCFASRMQRQRLVRPPDTGAATADLALELTP